MDVHQMNFTYKFDVVICAEVIEHVSNPFLAIEQIYRVLNPDGLLVLTAPMKLEIHGSPFDYWRYTPQGFEVLLTKYNHKYITFSGSQNFPSTICAVASNTELNKIVISNILNWELRHKKIIKTNKLLEILIFNFVPPVFWGSHYEFWLRRRDKNLFSLFKLFIPNVLRLKWKTA
jgi:2-polyprenyl-3-methyl-5-hydroxy-6-metoxy-1,4-benzoquinol methylase